MGSSWLRFFCFSFFFLVVVAVVAAVVVDLSLPFFVFRYEPSAEAVDRFMDRWWGDRHLFITTFPFSVVATTTTEAMKEDEVVV